MYRGRGGPPRAGAWLLLLLAWAGPGRAQEPPAGSPVPLAVRDGRCECVLPTGRPDAKYFLLLGSVARAAGPYRVRVRTEPVDSPVSMPLDGSDPDPAWARRTRQLHERL